jgi:hypothetical protein
MSSKPTQSSRVVRNKHTQKPHMQAQLNSSKALEVRQTLNCILDEFELAINLSSSLSNRQLLRLLARCTQIVKENLKHRQ